MKRVKFLDETVQAEYNQAEMEIKDPVQGTFKLGPTALRTLIAFAADVGMVKLDYGVEVTLPKPPQDAYLGPF